MAATKKIDFDCPPPPDTVLMWKGQRYRYLRAHPHKSKKDGGRTYLLVGETHCAECDDPIEVMTPMKNGGSPSRRCTRHAKAGVRV